MVASSLVVVLALGAAAAVPLEDDPVFLEAEQLAEDFEYEKAVFRYKAALRVEGRTDSELARVHIRLGIAYAELRDVAGAERAFEDALQKNPLSTLPPDASPTLREMMDRVRQRLAEQAARAPAPEPPPPEPPAPDETAPLVDDAPSSSASPSSAEQSPEETPWLLYGGGALAAVGLGTVLVGVAGLGGGFALNQLAAGQQFQSDAATLNTAANVVFVGGQVGVLAGPAVVVVGAAVAVASFFIDGM